MIRRFAAALLAFLATTAFAQAPYPARPINLIVAYATGGGTDIIARVIAPFVEKHLGGGAKIVVVNRTGAGGEIGFTALQESAPDGYTIGMVNTPNLISIPIERASKMHWSRFDLLGNLVDDPGGFAVHKDSGIATLAQLAAYAKANPGAVTVGSTGVGSDDHLAMLMFERLAGVKMTHVPFPGSSAVRTALVGKQIMVGSMNIGEGLQYVKGGSPMVNLGQMSAQRLELAAAIPTFREQGFAMEFASLRGLAAPKGLPPEIRERLVAAIAKAVAEPEFVQRSRDAFSPLRYLAPADYAAEMKQIEEALKKLWQEAPWSEK